MLMHELGRDWTQGKKRYIPGPATAWPSRALASIVINTEDEDCPVWHEVGIEHILPKLELRAIFRLSGALFNMKGGVAQEAAGLLDDMASRCRMFEPEKACFKDLGDGIALAVSAFKDRFRLTAKETEDEHVMLLSVNGVDTAKTTPNAMLKTRASLAPAVQYWDDKYEPDFTKPSTYQELSDLISASSDSCVPLVSDRSSIGLSPKTELRASKDHQPGDPILYERRSWGVSTCMPEEVMDAWEKNKAGYLRLYCDTCATALLMPEDLVAYVLAEGSRGKSSTKQEMHDLRRTVNYPNMSDEQQGKRVEWSFRTHISMCSPEHEAIYCCTTCRKHRRAFDFGVHDSNIEMELRNGKLKTVEMPLENVRYCHPRSLYCHSKTQTLYDLLFLRIYASAVNEDEHPLELVKFVSGELSLPSAHTPNNPNNPQPNQIPWSFQNNIARPIWIIHRYHESLDQDPFCYLKQSDGWVINTLLAKIQRSATIAAGAMSAVILNIEKLEKTYCYRGLEPWVSDKHETIYESEEQFNDVWVARLDPLVSMIRVADEAKGEKPNCWLKYEEGVRVIAGQPNDPPNKKGFAIKQGEVLLRARPKFLGGSPYEVTRHTQRDPKPKVRPASPEKSSSPVQEDHHTGESGAHRADRADRDVERGGDHCQEQGEDHRNKSSGDPSEDPGEDHDGDQTMPDAVVESTEPLSADEPTLPDAAEVEAGSESSSKSDEEMLDILDRDSNSPIETSGEGAKPRGKGLPSSQPSSPVETSFKGLPTSRTIANLDGQAESIGTPIKSLSPPPAEEPEEGEIEVDEWEEVDIIKRRLGTHRRRLSGYPDRPPDTVDYRTVDIRRAEGYWPPRNSLHMRRGIHLRLPTRPRQLSRPSTPQPRRLGRSSTPGSPPGRLTPLPEHLLTGIPPGSPATRNFQALQGTSHGLPLPEQESELDALGGPPLGRIPRSGFMLDHSEPPTAREAERVLEMRSVVDVRRGRPVPERGTEGAAEKEGTDEVTEKKEGSGKEAENKGTGEDAAKDETAEGADREGTGKGKEGLRGGDAWFTVCDGASDEEEFYQGMSDWGIDIGCWGVV
ncbi:MAG: hypothetical protein Q9184_007620 [Pyrenodesmia sp. 2 TL-2023]